jgi:signal transduction histidine kinase
MNITNRKRIENEINDKNEQLLKVNAEKDKFFSIIAHDLRSPLSSFLGITQMFAEDLSSMKQADLQEMAVSMEKSASNLYRLLENLLEWAKMQRGLIPFNPVVVTLGSTVSESMEMLLESIKNKEIEITIDIPDDIRVVVDTNMLQTVIRNYVSNAVKFTPRGGKINLSAKVTGNDFVEISVKDSGIGMSLAILNNLFELNVKTNRKGTEGESSSGLGLLLCKEFIEKQGGKIWVESEEGKGSVFYFTLPIKDALL